jgi:CelD/BcsL family acetyltransferase involved in cellulose biosynthesis
MCLHPRFSCDAAGTARLRARSPPGLAGRDIGYILGAVFEDEYRGLQFSYNDEHAALGIGGLLQYHQVVELCAAGVARYDLGTEMDYKRRWAEDVMTTEMLVLVR